MDTSNMPVLQENQIAWKLTETSTTLKSCTHDKNDDDDEDEKVALVSQVQAIFYLKERSYN